MLSTSVIKNASDAGHYFSSKDNYYTQEEGLKQSEWYGKGAEKLGLRGEVDPQSFTDLLKGKLVNGLQLGKVVDGEIKHRAGWDLTFSAPKSVSILALVGGDKRLIEAHRKAVTVALSHIERSCAQARVKIGNDIDYQPTQNIVAALYHHDLSRAQDPQMHTHSVVMNVTQRSDGQWRSQASQIGRYDHQAKNEVNGFIERVRHDKRYFGKVYEAELAFLTKELGYEIEVNAKTGVFEIVGVSSEVNQFFSKRRNQIEAELEKQGFSSAKAAERATLKTRESKNNIDRETLIYEWQHQAKQLGLDYEKIIESAINKNNPTIQPISTSLNIPDLQAEKIIQQAAHQIARFKTTFTLEEVATTALGYSIQNPIRIDAILKAIQSAQVSGELISIANEEGKTVFMAKTTLADEKRLFEQLAKGKSLQTLIEKITLDDFLASNNTINPENQVHLKTIFNQDPVILIEGKAAKEALIAPIVKLTQFAQLQLAVLSPNQVGSKQFANEISPKPTSFWGQIKALFVDPHIKNYGVMQFLSQFSAEKPAHNIPSLLIVDNAHLLSTHQKANLIEWNATHQTKLILLGDKKTLLPQQTGTSFEQLMNHSVKTISFNHEQSSHPFSENEKIHAAIHQLKDHTIEIKKTDDRLHAMASQLSQMKEEDRHRSWLVSHQKTSIETLNQLTHDKLKKQGQLGKSMMLPVLIPVFISENKLAQATTYLKNQVIRFNENYKSLSITRGEYLHILSHHKETNRVILQKSNGKQLVWYPDKVAGTQPGKVELFTEKMRELSVGESVTFHRSIKSSHIVKGERLAIENMYGNLIKLKSFDGKSHVIDISKTHHRHLDYGYAATLHAIAHEKPTMLIADLTAKSFGTDQRRFYQTMTQPSIAWIYTDDAKKLATHLEKKSGNKLSAHETLTQAEEIKKNFHVLYDLLEKQIIHAAAKNAKPLSHSAVEAIDYAIHHLSEREAAFSHQQIVETAMNHALGEVNAEHLNQAINAIEKANILIRGTQKNEALWTTLDAIKTERNIIALCHQGKGTLQSIANNDLIEKYCDPTKLKPEQIAAIKTIVQTRDPIIAIQGYPGTGKTTLLATVKDILSANPLFKTEGYELLGLAPTNKAVSELKKGGLSGQTLDSFILQTQQEKESNPSLVKPHLVLVIDEASMVSNKKALDALKLIHDLKCRAVFVGDTRQLPAIESGKPHDLIQRHVTTNHLTDIRRQHDATLKKAVKETIDYDFKAAFKTLKNSIIEVNEKTYPLIKGENRDEEKSREAIRLARMDRLVKDYFSYPQEKWDSIQIITPGHDDRVLVNERIRDQLKQSGILSKDHELSCQILSSKSLTQSERSQSTHFKIGDVLRFSQGQAVGIKAGEYLTVVDIEHKHHLLTLKKSDGTELTWQVPTYNKKRTSPIEVFKAETRPIQAGDLIRWSRTDKENALFSTEPARVTAVEKNKITVTLANQKTFTFDSQDPRYQHWDHGYAATVYAVQADTKNIVLAHLESHRKNLTSQPAFLVALTRAVDVFRLYTDDAKALLQLVEKNAGTKFSSLEVMGEHPKSSLQQQMTAYEKNQVVLAKMVDGAPLLPRISEKMIANFSKKLAKEGQHHKPHLDSYQLIKQEIQQKEITKPLNPIKNIEREI